MVYEYVNFPIALVNEGITESKVFSIYPSTEDEPGNILFGAIDEMKYTGELFTIPTLAGMDYLTRVWKGLIWGIRVDDTSVNETMNPFAVVFDTGTAGLHLPSFIVDDLGNKLNGTFDDDSWIIPEDQWNKTIGFDMGGNFIEIPLESLLRDVGGNKRALAIGRVEESNWDWGCLAGVEFKIHVYMIFNMETLGKGYYGSITMGQLRRTDEEKIRVIGSDGYIAPVAPSYSIDSSTSTTAA